MRLPVFVAVIFTLFIGNVYPEIIDGPANVRTGPKGDLICSLNDRVFVDCDDHFKTDI